MLVAAAVSRPARITRHVKAHSVGGGGMECEVNSREK